MNEDELRRMIVGRTTYERPEDGDWWSFVAGPSVGHSLNDALNEIELLRLALVRGDEDQ